MLCKRGVFGQIVLEKIQYSRGERNDFAGGWGFRSVLFKICSFSMAFLVSFEILHCENRLTLFIVCV